MGGLGGPGGFKGKFERQFIDIPLRPATAHQVQVSLVRIGLVLSEPEPLAPVVIPQKRLAHPPP